MLATHSNQSQSIIKDISENEKNVLGKINYQKNTAIIHTDTSILPKRKEFFILDSGHLPHMENPNEFNKILLSILN